MGRLIRAEAHRLSKKRLRLRAIIVQPFGFMPLSFWRMWLNAMREWPANIIRKVDPTRRSIGRIYWMARHSFVCLISAENLPLNNAIEACVAPKSSNRKF